MEYKFKCYYSLIDVKELKDFLTQRLKMWFCLMCEQDYSFEIIENYKDGTFNLYIHINNIVKKYLSISFQCIDKRYKEKNIFKRKLLSETKKIDFWKIEDYLFACSIYFLFE